MNYRQVYAMKKAREDKIKQLCPGITENSGIYAFYRVDENGIKHCYVGQARNLLERTAAHLGEYDHLALSLKKRGLYSDANLYGWRLGFVGCRIEHLDEKEREYIKELACSGYQLYNVTLGGQGEGKKNIKEGKTARGYYDGLKQGKKNAQRFVANLFEKHLDYSPKSQKPNKNQEKAMEKFRAFLEE